MHGSSNVVKTIPTYAVKHTERVISLRPGEGTEWKGCAKVYFYSDFVLAFILLFSSTGDNNGGRVGVDRYGRYLAATKEGRKYTSKNSHYHYSFLHIL